MKNDKINDVQKKENPMSNEGSFSKNKIRKKRNLIQSAETYISGILGGDSIMLSKAITLAESTKPAHEIRAQEIIEACLSSSGKSTRIAVSGAPGVGKSSFIEAFGQELLKKGEKLAILAIDPSSQQSGGSILGDKTRMSELGSHANVFIRPSPAGKTLGGVAKSTRESILLCEAAGYQNIIIETVGVGQSEIAVHSMVDCFLLLLLPGAGDELQGIKRGIVEMADIVVVNKSDGDRKTLAKQTKRAYQNALHLYPLKAHGFPPTVVQCSSLEKVGITEVHQLINEFIAHNKTKSDYFNQNRIAQRKFWLQESIGTQLQTIFMTNPAVATNYSALEKKVMKGQISAYQAALTLLSYFEKK